MPTFEIELEDGSTHRVEADTSDQAVAKLTATYARQQARSAPPTAEGSPWRVRMAVGSARTPQDRLSTIRRFYPDAVPYGNDNFVYTDETGQRRLYNPQGLDWGDIPAVGGEISEVIGGTIGGIGGGAAGVPGGPPGILAGAMLGAGVGANAAREAYDFGQRALGSTIDTRSLGEQLTDQAATIAWNAAGEGLGRVAMDAGTQYIQNRLVAPGAADRLREMQDLGIDISGAPGELADTPLAQRAAKYLEEYPTSMNVMSGARERTLGSFSERIADISGTPAPEAAGEALRQGAEIASGRFRDAMRTTREALLDATEDVDVMAGDMTQTMQLRNRISDAINRSPGASRHLLEAQRELDSLFSGEFAEGAPLSFHDILEHRTDLFQRLEAPEMATGYVGKSKQGLREVYRTLRKDMENVLQRKRPVAVGLLTDADDAVKAFRAEAGATGKAAADVLEAIANRETGRLFNYAMEGSKFDASRLRQLRDLMPEEQWEQFAGSAVERLGYSPRFNGFSIDRFVTRWNELTDESKRVLFGRDYSTLNRLARVGESMKEVESMANRSNTATALTMRNLLTGGALFGGASAADVGLPGAGLVAAGLPYLAARGMTSPRYADFALGGPAGPLAQTVGGLTGRTAYQFAPGVLD